MPTSKAVPVASRHHDGRRASRHRPLSRHRARTSRGLARSLEQERCADALVAAKAEAAAHLAQHVHHAEDVVAMETTESFFSSSTMTPSMGAQRAAWTNTATDAMSPRTRAFIKAR